MLPLQVRHARDQENFLGDIPAAQDFQVEAAGEAMEHLRYVFRIQRRKDQQVCPGAVLGDLGLDEVAMSPRWSCILVAICASILVIVCVPGKLEARRNRCEM